MTKASRKKQATRAENLKEHLRTTLGDLQKARLEIAELERQVRQAAHFEVISGMVAPIVASTGEPRQVLAELLDREETTPSKEVLSELKMMFLLGYHSRIDEAFDAVLAHLPSEQVSTE